MLKSYLENRYFLLKFQEEYVLGLVLSSRELPTKFPGWHQNIEDILSKIQKRVTKSCHIWNNFGIYLHPLMQTLIRKKKAIGIKGQDSYFASPLPQHFPVLPNNWVLLALHLIIYFYKRIRTSSKF